MKRLLLIALLMVSACKEEKRPVRMEKLFEYPASHSRDTRKAKVERVKLAFLPKQVADSVYGKNCNMCGKVSAREIAEQAAFLAKHGGINLGE